MRNILTNTTDNFLCYSLKKIVAKTEQKYKKSNIKEDIETALHHFEQNPLGCMIGLDSKFEKSIKIKIKLIIGLFFIALPLVVMSALATILHIPLEVPFLIMFAIALFVSQRTEVIAKRYVTTRSLTLHHHS